MKRYLIFWAMLFIVAALSMVGRTRKSVAFLLMGTLALLFSLVCIEAQEKSLAIFILGFAGYNIVSGVWQFVRDAK
jgi:hypothetical protein